MKDQSISRLAIADDPVVSQIGNDIDVLAMIELFVGHANAIVIEPDDLHTSSGKVHEFDVHNLIWNLRL